jgi:hypothetical protein
LTPNGRLEKRHYCSAQRSDDKGPQQKASYLITSSAVVTPETGHGGLKQRERDFREKEREEDEAIIRATDKKKARKKFQAFVHFD